MTSTSQYEEFFNKVDKDNSNSVSLAEMKEFLTKQGHTSSDVEKLFDAADISADGNITLTEFLTTMSCATPEQIRRASLRRAFNGFDQDKSGSINKSELKAVLEEQGGEFTEDEISRAMAMVDSSGDETINYEEFIARFFGGGD